MKKLLVITGIFGVGGFLAWHFTNQYKLLKNTCFTFGGFVINSLSKNGVSMAIKLNLRNRSDLSFALKGYNFNIYINNTLVTTAYSNATQVIERDSFAPLELLIDINPKTFVKPGFLTSFILNYGQAMVKIEGSVSINAAGVPVNKVPVKIESKLMDMMPAPGSSANNQPCI